MREQCLKNQLVLFGQFGFLPVPDVTLGLMQIFAPLGLMPSVIQQVDSNGAVQQKISLSKGETFQIIFGQDRIDFIEILHEGEWTANDFYASLTPLLIALHPRALTFNRLAVVTERLLYELSPQDKEALRVKFANAMPAAAVEWGFRWVEPQVEQGEPLNVALDVARLQGVMMKANMGVQFDGVRILHDISTAPSNKLMRFNFANLAENIENLLSKTRQQVEATLYTPA